MKKLRGFRLGGRLVRVFKCIIRSRRRKPTTARPIAGGSLNPISRILALARNLRRRTSQRSNRGYIRLGEAKPVEVPKGHLVVYVGESNGDTRREVVPVIYINHPLFGELLKDTERVYGYNHSGGIKIPCGYSEFEKVKMRIASWGNCHNATWKQRKY
ncbi:auxin-responsive protein SAUR36 [Manihot esculenta]|uniref:Uncharacterized protein n=1 Tax=Manihot esculenta TaxID=3983 RepID=A0A2C9WKZ4_MANES|nr:auxin-responsive protein SAUR36 [Manihot esculenta]OAY59973.1 hypothetical protein MANES_01G075900v8 [Manihot esculenta]